MFFRAVKQATLIMHRDKINRFLSNKYETSYTFEAGYPHIIRLRFYPKDMHGDMHGKQVSVKAASLPGCLCGSAES